jgi:hypothetical protein
MTFRRPPVVREAGQGAAAAQAARRGRFGAPGKRHGDEGISNKSASIGQARSVDTSDEFV